MEKINIKYKDLIIQKISNGLCWNMEGVMPICLFKMKTIDDACIKLAFEICSEYGISIEFRRMRGGDGWDGNWKCFFEKRLVDYLDGEEELIKYIKNLDCKKDCFLLKKSGLLKLVL